MSARRDRAEAVLSDTLQECARDLLRYLERRVGPDDAQDSLGEVLLVAWRRVDDLPDSGAEARLWLFGIARNTLLNVRRGRARRAGLAERLRAENPRPLDPSADAGHDVRDAVDRLEPGLAEVVRLVHWDGFSVAEAARILDVPPSTAMSRYHRAKRLLRETFASPDPDDAQPSRRVTNDRPPAPVRAATG